MGTVEAFPACEDVIKLVKAGKFKSVVLSPLMLVAGDHANNDMAGDEDDSWKSQFEKAGFKVTTNIKGLGEYPAIRRLYVQHVGKALGVEPKVTLDPK